VERPLPRPIQFAVEQAPHLTERDRLQLEVDGVVQPELHAVWAGERALMGFGIEGFGEDPFGVGDSLGFGLGSFGAGAFGEEDVALAILRTSQAFAHGDYTLRVRAVDELGNAGDWSDPLEQQHRYRPDPPTIVSLDAGILTWTGPPA
jgi:hypothetical protein